MCIYVYIYIYIEREREQTKVRHIKQQLGNTVLSYNPWNLIQKWVTHMKHNPEGNSLMRKDASTYNGFHSKVAARGFHIQDLLGLGLLCLLLTARG